MGLRRHRLRAAVRLLPFDDDAARIQFPKRQQKIRVEVSVVGARPVQEVLVICWLIYYRSILVVDIRLPSVGTRGCGALLRDHRCHSRRRRCSGGG